MDVCLCVCGAASTIDDTHRRPTEYNMKTKTKTKIHIDCDSLSLWFIVSQILTELYTRIGVEHSDWRSSILSSLYGLVECTSATILLSVARVVLVVTFLLYSHIFYAHFFRHFHLLTHSLFSFGHMIHFHSIYI